jgi:ribonuclease-3
LPHLDEALTHPSYVNEHPGRCNYQRLEFLGDAVLGLCVSELLLARWPKAREGEMSRMRASLVNTHALAAFATSHDIPRFMFFGRGTAESVDAKQPKVLADAVEGIVGAVYLDLGMDAARKFTHTIVANSLDAAELSARDPKSELQELLQRGGGKAPVYRTVASEGSGIDCFFEVEVEQDGVALGRGRGRSKKVAEREAASAVLAAFAAKSETSP